MSSSRRLRFDRPPAGGRVRPIEIFRRNFTIVQANSKELLDQVFRLRFQVYCQERGFENADAFPDGRERDRDDSRSNHFLVLYCKAKAAEAMPVGTVRLILPRRGTDLPVIGMLQKHDRCRVGLPIESTAEVSRLAVPRAFRRQLQRDLSHQVDRVSAENSAQRALALLNFWLVRGVGRMTANRGITHIVAMMEPALLRLLRRLAIEFQPLGQMVEHHGLRQPVWAATANLADRIRRGRPELWEIAFDAAWDLPRAPTLA
jgi:N-acyl amino acid synthase of PEP-CTERM/exosortase system